MHCLVTGIFCGLVMAVVATAAADDVASSKKKVVDDKVNLGWPNFFNPEKAILRKKEGVLKKKKASQGDKSSVLGDTLKSSQELLEENRLANIVKDKDNAEGQWDELTDLKIKDGLRGSIAILDGQERKAYLGPDEIPRETVALVQEQLLNETNVYRELSEVSDDGLHLAMPLFRKRYTSELGKYGAEITYFYGQDPVSFLYYGNWCGRGGRIAPVDRLDKCCLEHAKCYGRQVRNCPDVWKKPYSTMYAWTLLDDVPYCVRSESGCINSICGCDIEASLCMHNAIEERELKPIIEELDILAKEQDDEEFTIEAEI